MPILNRSHTRAVLIFTRATNWHCEKEREQSGVKTASNMSAEIASFHENQYGGRFAQISKLRISTVYLSRITNQVFEYLPLSQ